MNRRYLTRGIIALLLMAALAACGGDGDPGGEAQAVTATSSTTADQRPTLPHTWTPQPTAPPPTPRPTLDYSYTRPTLTTFVPPTYTPSPAPPTVTPTHAPSTRTPVPTQPPVEQDLTLTVPLAALNEFAQAEFDAGTASYLLSAPRFNVQPPTSMIVLVNMLTDAAAPNSGANLVIRATIGLDDAGHITLTRTSANLLGSTEQLESELVLALLDTLETRTDEALAALFASGVPGGVSYTITAVQVTEAGLLVDVRALQAAPTPTEVVPTSTPGVPVG